jgi:hypothetical protein
MKNAQQSKPRLFESMTQAATVLNIPLAVLKSAKKRGCPAFKHGRVSESLVGWIKKNPAPNEEPKVSEKERLQAQKLSKEIEKLDFERQKALGEYALVSEQKEAIFKFMAVVQEVLTAFVEPSILEKALLELKKRIKDLA